MAGTFIGSKGCALPMSTLSFDDMSERIRIALMAKDPVVAKECYAPVDEGGMTFLFLEVIDARSFRLFVETTEEACLKASAETSFAPRAALWHDLLDMLRQDARLMASC